MAASSSTARLYHQHGFGYFGVLFAVALIGLGLSGAALIWQVQQQREKESELLFVGAQFKAAIASYYQGGPGGLKKYPRSLADLLRDPRYPTVKRHLRRIWRDPLTGSAEWGLVRTPQGGIAGIYSLAAGTPIKQAGFGEDESWFSSSSRFLDWQFIYFSENEAMEISAPDEDAETVDVPEEDSFAGEAEDDAGIDAGDSADEEFTEDEWKKGAA